MKRRFVLGLREVTKHLKSRKIKCVIISPNLERVQSRGRCHVRLGRASCCDGVAFRFIVFVLEGLRGKDADLRIHNAR